METLLEYIPEIIWWWPRASELVEDIFTTEEGWSYDYQVFPFIPALRTDRHTAPPALFLCPGAHTPWVRCVSLKSSMLDH